MNKQNAYIVLSVFTFSILVSLIDAVVHPDYFVKIPIKILFFLVLPMTFFVVNKRDSNEFKKLFALRKTGILMTA